MIHSILLLAAFVQFASAVYDASPATRAIVNSQRGAIAALDNIVIITDSTTQDYSVSYYTYVSSSVAPLAAGDYVFDSSTPGVSAQDVTLASAITLTDFRDVRDKTGTAFAGFGYAAAIADTNNFFISQTVLGDTQTGRVVVFQGNFSLYKAEQVLVPYDGKHSQASDAAFGEAIAAKQGTLAVGCQQCNTSAPIGSGAVYVYKPTESGSWSESQTLTPDGIMYFGERVAIDQKVLIAAGDDKSEKRASEHYWSNVADSVVVFYEGPDGKFQQNQVIQARYSSFAERISSIAVFDEMIALTTIGADTSLSPIVETVSDKLYIFYPETERYGLKGPSGPKMQWTNTQILKTVDSVNKRYLNGNPSVSLTHNTVAYLGVKHSNDIVQIYSSSKSCLSCQFSLISNAKASNAKTVKNMLLTSDKNSFYAAGIEASVVAGLQLITPMTKPEPVTMKGECLILVLQDQFNDGWGTASLVVDGPGGRKDKFTLHCTTKNPMVHLYCPQSLDVDQTYRLHIENGEETPFGWEILWKVYAKGTWYVGDKHTRMDFNWDGKYNEFFPGPSKSVLPTIDTCKVCSDKKPEPKHRSLSNLRALHHRGKTASPTMTNAPTLLHTFYNSDTWNLFQMTAEVVGIASTPWFSNGYDGAYFWVANSDGSKLIQTGTACTAAVTSCWVELPDGEYKLRVGASTHQSDREEGTFKFCGMNNAHKLDKQISFTVKDGKCFPGQLRETTTLCTIDYDAAYHLKVDLFLGGAVTALSVSDESTLSMALTQTLQTEQGSVKVVSQTLRSAGLDVSVMVKVHNADDATLENMMSASVSSLLKYELIGSNTLSANFLAGDVSSVMITSVSISEEKDFSNIDESSFKTVTDHLWLTPTSEKSSSSFHDYARYVAEGAYAIVAVAALLAVSFFVKRVMSSTPTADSSPSFKPTFSSSDMDRMEASSEEDSESEAPVNVTPKEKKRVKLTSLPKSNVNVSGLKNLVADEDEMFKSFKNKAKK